MVRSREEISRELAGYLLGIIGVLVLLAALTYHPSDPSLFSAGSDTVHNLLSYGGAAIAGVLVGLLGLSALIVPVLMMVVGWHWLRGHELESPRLQGTAWVVAIIGADGLLAALIGRTPYRGGELDWGGEMGRLVARGLNESLGPVATLLLCAAALLAGVVLGVRGSLLLFFSGAGGLLAGKRSEMSARWARRREDRRREEMRRELLRRHQERHPGAPQPVLVAHERFGNARFRIRRVLRVALVSEDAPPPRRAPSGRATASERSGPGDEPAPSPRQQRTPARRAEAEPVQEEFKFPEAPISPLPEKTMLLLPPPAPEIDPRQLSAMREHVEAKCQEFKVDGKVEDVLPGPVITTYEFRPAAGVKYAQVVRLEEDLALGLQVEAVRIERIPGKATVGIEVPNPERQTIVLREIIESSKFVHSASPLTLALGKDIHGRPFVADMQRMPHLLIGGFTGSGKSVGINAMIMSILFKATPEQVRFILIDPKQVELGMYERLPHLLTPIISDPKEAARALRWAVRQMRERYALLAACKVRNLTQYNALLGDSETRRVAAESAGTSELAPLPFIVVIIDELADLMMTCASEVEDSIGHLSQMARAVGIHLLFATQRPSVDIVTGVIKANFPCRISYKVRTRFDSRTILDTEGAECLLGMGDMLYLAAGTSRPVRLHGCLVREEEILTVLKQLRRLGKPEFDPGVLAEPEPGASFNGGTEWDDPMYAQAARLVVSSRKASASYIQRKLRLGYARSARLLDMMEQEGVVGPSQGSRGREVLAPPDYFGEVDATLQDDGEEDPSDG
ncbi:MAG: DNA translocase FtsK 4TM domain-containing protein [Acidobacteriia bacterium]|nr:DNA translocase FtsK 4TM domain-containing protein [Terriglobia bacterium]